MSRGAWIITIAVLTLIVVTVVPGIDRAMRSTTLDGIRSARAVHVTHDGRLVVTEYGDAGAPEGRVLVVEPTTGQQTVVLEGLWQPEGADMSGDGTVCAVVAGSPADGPELLCDDGRRVGLAVDGQPIRPTDLLADGANWYVASAEPPAVLRITPDGDVRPMMSFAAEGRFDGATPLGLTVSADRQLWIALGTSGIARASLDAPGEPAPFQYVGSDVAWAVLPRPSGVVLLLGDRNGTGGRISWCCGFHGDHRAVLDGLIQPRGLALSADGRLAVSAEERVTLYRADALPGA